MWGNKEDQVPSPKAGEHSPGRYGFGGLKNLGGKTMKNWKLGGQSNKEAEEKNHRLEEEFNQQQQEFDATQQIVHELQAQIRSLSEEKSELVKTHAKEKDRWRKERRNLIQFSVGANKDDDSPLIQVEECADEAPAAMDNSTVDMEVAMGAIEQLERYSRSQMKGMFQDSMNQLAVYAELCKKNATKVSTTDRPTETETEEESEQPEQQRPTDNTASNQELDEIRENLQQSEESRRKLEGELSEYQEKVVALQSQLSQVQEQRDSVPSPTPGSPSTPNQQPLNDSQNEELRSQLQQLTTQVASKEEDIQRLQAEIKEKEAATEQVRKELQQEIKDIKAECKSQYDTLDQEVAEMDKVQDALKEQLEDAQAVSTKLEEQNKAGEAKLKEIAQMLTVKECEYTELQEELSVAKQQWEETEAELKRKAEQVRDEMNSTLSTRDKDKGAVVIERDRLRDENTQLQKSLKEANEGKKEWEERSAIQRQQAETRMKLYADKEHEFTTMQEDLAGQLKKLTAEHQKTQSELTTKASTLEELITKLKQQQQLNGTLDATVATNKKEIDSLRQEMAKLTKENDAKQRETRDALANCKDKEIEKISLQAKLEAAKDDIADKVNQIAKLNKKIQDMEGQTAEMVRMKRSVDQNMEEMKIKENSNSNIISTMQDNIEALTQKCNDLQRKLNEKEKEVIGWAKKEISWKEEQLMLGKKNDRQEETERELASNVRELKKECDGLKTQQIKLQNELIVARRSEMDLRDQLTQAQGQIEREDRNKRLWDAERENLQSSMSAMVQQLKDTQGTENFENNQIVTIPSLKREIEDLVERLGEAQKDRWKSEELAQALRKEVQQQDEVITLLRDSIESQKPGAQVAGAKKGWSSAWRK